MFSSIKTSKENKEKVIHLTRKLNLRAENIIARLAFAYSLSQERILDLSKVQDSQGKEYSSKVLFGDYALFYVSMICVHYNIHISDKDLTKYIKMHVDDGLELLDNAYQKSSGSAGTDFLIQKIEKGLSII